MKMIDLSPYNDVFALIRIISFEVSLEETFLVILWNPSTKGSVNWEKQKRWKRKTSVIENLLKDTKFGNKNEIKTAMLDHEG